MITYCLRPIFGCDVGGVRATNVVCMIALTWILEKIFSHRMGGGQAAKHGVFLASHSALNTALLPPLFFFSALYYTDVASTLSVMLCFYPLICSDESEVKQIWWHLRLFLLGLVSLSFRQTNIFWVAIFPAAAVLLRELDQGHELVKESIYNKSKGFGDTMANVARTTWKMDVLYDPPVRDASMEGKFHTKCLARVQPLTNLPDYAKAVVSIVACTLKLLTQPKRLLDIAKVLQPFIALVVAFATFVVINGGVVLGDKSNHIPALHTPQLLYLWPYLVFFSWPFAYQHLIRVPLTFIAHLPIVADLEHFLLFKRRALLPRILVLALFVAIALLAVHFNTIVHPFSLADNRHYVFYVFRLLRHKWWIRYAATPAYIACAWLSIQALGSAPQDRTKPSGPADPTPPNERKAATASRGSPRRLLPLPDTTESANTSFLIIWLFTTSLTLISAPLVEPRYFILPWIFFRLHLPLSHPQQMSEKKKNGDAMPPASLVTKLWSQHDNRLWLETLWFAVVNAATMWMFLNRGFEWAQEPGNVQRFMW